MSKNYFTEEQIKQLKINKYLKQVSEKAITYTEKLKEIFISQYNDNKFSYEILLKMGFDTRVLGQR